MFVFPAPYIASDASNFPVVEATNTGFATLTNYAVPLPSGIVSGDLLLMLIGNAANAARSTTTPSGWTSLYSVVGPSTLRRGTCYYKVATGSEGSTQTVSANGSNRWATIAYRISGFQGAPEAPTPATGLSSSPNPPSLTPSWGAAKTLWLAVSYHVALGAFVQGAPTDYTNVIQVVRLSSGSDSPRTASARRSFQGATEDPGEFSQSVTRWIAATIAIRPA